MSLGAPNLYIDGNMFGGSDTRRALAGISFTWGEDSRVDFAGPATMSGEVSVAGTMPAYITGGAAIGLVDPASGRCLFAGHIATLTASPDPVWQGRIRIAFTASSPLVDLANHSLAVDWVRNTHAARFISLRSAMPRGWTLQGYNGATMDWVESGRLRFAKANYLDLLSRYCRSVLGRYHDTSAYVPGTGLVKRITLTGERDKTATAPPAPGASGIWSTTGKPAAATGIAALPAALVEQAIEWEKNADDTITDVQVTNYGAEVLPEGEDTAGFEVWMSVFVNNQAMQDKYGFRQLTIDTSVHLHSGNDSAFLNALSAFWLDADTKWRPTGLRIADSRKVTTAALLNLLAVDTRHMAAISVPGAAGLVPGEIHAYVHSGSAQWTGKKWITDLTLGRTL